METIQLQFYSKEHCPLCDSGLALVHELAQEFPLAIEVIDIYQDDQLLEKYQLLIPVVAVAGEDIDYGQLSKQKIKKRLHSVAG